MDGKPTPLVTLPPTAEVSTDEIRMSALQKMQAAAGGKPLGPNGQPSPAQIEAMRASPHSSISTVLI